MPQYTLERQDVLNLAINTLAPLPLMARGEQVQVTDLLHVLVFAAASQISVHQACRDLGSAPTGQTMLGELAAQLADVDQLEGTLHTLLARLIPKSLGRRGRQVAIDLIELPYHGTVEEEHQRKVCRGKAKQGTTHFFTYATAYAVVNGNRYTLALCRVTDQMTMDQVLKRLFHSLNPLGIKSQSCCSIEASTASRSSEPCLKANNPLSCPQSNVAKPPHSLACQRTRMSWLSELVVPGLYIE